jgi:hypothetical protein
MTYVMLLFLLLWCLSAVGFAWRGIALLLRMRTRPGRIITTSGVVAMISMWLFAGLTPFAASSFVSIYNEFDLAVPPATELAISLFDWPSFLRLLWCPIAFGLGVLTLVLPEILFNPQQVKKP